MATATTKRGIGRRFLGRLALLALGLSIAFGLLELVFRLLPAERSFRQAVAEFAAVALTPDDHLGHRVVPASQVEVDGVRYRFSSVGTRGGEPEPRARTRVLVIGDSVSMGWGVAEADTLPAQLEARLHAAGRAVQVLNAGVIGYGVEQELRWLEELLPILSPDVVLLAYFPNDPEPPGDAIGGPSWSAAWRFVGPRLQALLVTLGAASTATEHHRALHAPGSAGWERATRALGQLAGRCQVARIRCGLLLLPELTTRPYPLAEVHRRLAERAAALELPVLDLAPAIADEDPRSLWVAADDAHPNPRGHLRYATAAADWLVRVGLLSDRPPDTLGR